MVSLVILQDTMNNHSLHFLYIIHNVIDLLQLSVIPFMKQGVQVYAVLVCKLFHTANPFFSISVISQALFFFSY